MNLDLSTRFPLAIEERPENRRRRAEAPLAVVWESLRSEAFFEDLDPAPALHAVSLPSGYPSALAA